MSEWDALAPYVYVLGAVLVWWALFYFLQTRKVLERHNLALAGPILMWRTQRGRDAIDRMARPKRFWRAYGDLSLILVAAAMVAVTALLVWEATLVQSAAIRANPPSPTQILGLPGINPWIPVGYGIFGLALAVVLHEFAHGILSRAANVNVRSVGGVFLIVPIGAFVEPDEDEMRKMPRHERMRLYAAGPGTNIVLAVLFAFLFSTVMMTSVVPIHAGVGVVGFAGPNSPSELAGLQPYTVITELNNTPINSYSDFVAALGATRPGQNVAVVTYDGSQYATAHVVMGENPDNKSLAYMGIYAFDVSTDYYHPLTNMSRFGGLPYAVLSYISLPFQGRAPIQDPALRFYRVTGPLAAVPASLFWVVTNTLYWLFWLNIMLGATNALPAVPLDGGYIFKDALEAVVTRLKRGIQGEDRDRIVAQVTYLSALFILALIVWQLIGPRL